jgi:hypothetical protein
MEDVTKQVNEKVIFKYNTRDFEEQDVAYYSYTLKTDKMQDALLGDYDQQGAYTLQQEDLKTLTKLNKVVAKKEDDVLYLKATCNTHEFSFFVKVESISKKKKVAQLFLVENTSVITSKNDKIITPVSSYVDDNDIYFEEKYKKIFNVIADDEDGKKEQNNEIAKVLLGKIDFSSKVFNNYLLRTRLKDKIYVEKLIKLLQEDPSSAKVLKKYQFMLTKTLPTLNVRDKNYYRVLKQLLDEVIEEERKTLSSNLNLIILRMRGSYIKANMPIMEVLTTNQKKKVNDKLASSEIKLGKGAGLPSFSYYSGVKSKKAAAKENAKKYTPPYKMASSKDTSAAYVSKKTDDESFDFGNLGDYVSSFSMDIGKTKEEFKTFDISKKVIESSKAMPNEFNQQRKSTNAKVIVEKKASIEENYIKLFVNDDYLEK